MKKTLITLFILLIFNNSQAGWLDKKIKIDKCYDYKKYRSYRHQIKAEGKTIWEWEIDLERKVAIQTWGDNKRLDIAKHTVTIQTDKYLVARVSNPTAFQKKNNMEEVKFDLSKERVITRTNDFFFTFQCDFD